MQNPCQKSCTECKYAGECPSCRYNCEHELCDIAKCCRDRGHEVCETCTDRTFCPTLRSAPMMHRHRKEKLRSQAEAAEKRRTAAAVMTKLIKPLFVILVISEVIGLVTGLFGDIIAAPVTAAADIAVVVFSALHAFILLRLRQVGYRYQTAAKFLALSVVCSILTAVFGAFSFIALRAVGGAAAVMSEIFLWISVYHEYNAHSDAITDFDGYLAESWEKLWKYRISALAAFFGAGMFGAVFGLIAILVLLASAVMLIVTEILALVYLKRMLDALNYD